MTPTIIVIFGATGDLTRTKLVPALFRLHRGRLLPAQLSIVGFARRSLTDDAWRGLVRDICQDAGVASGEDLEQFIALFSYQAGFFEDAAAYRQLARLLGRQDTTWNTCANKLFYLAVPPQYYTTIFNNLAASGLTEPCGPDGGWTRVAVEKPFGKDLNDAKALDALLGRLFTENQVYRIDHYLGKETVQNILAFRFSNAMLAPAWDRDSIERIAIRLWETEGVDGRERFYDGLGALRDVGQNHLLQLLALFTMENPGEFTAAAVRQCRAQILEALPAMSDAAVAAHTVRAQYTGYRDLGSVAPNSATETYFSVRTELLSRRWAGVSVYLESGKCMGEANVEVVVTFRHKTPCLCPPAIGKHYQSILYYRIQPREGVTTSFWVKKPGPQMVIEEKDFSFDYQQAYGGELFVDAYAKLLLDAIAGDQTLFVSTREIMASWRFIDPILRAWQRNVVPLQEYASGMRELPPAPLYDARGLRRQIGYVGLGKMGLSMVERLAERQWSVIAFDADEQVLPAAVRVGATTVNTINGLRSAVATPRIVWVMVPHAAVDHVLHELSSDLVAGDVIIDGGNSFYKDSVRRAQDLARRGIAFLDVGVSGGPRGARFGACLMVGGERAVFEQLTELWQDVATAGGYGYMGAAGAGHFVKMVHNGIEYGMMQALAEGFTVLAQWDQLDVEKVAELFNHGSVIESRLVGWLQEAYATYGLQLDVVRGSVGYTGEGAWTVAAARELGIPVPIIEGALTFRIESQNHPSYVGRVLSALRGQFGGHDVTGAGDQ